MSQPDFEYLNYCPHVDGEGQWTIERTVRGSMNWIDLDTPTVLCADGDEYWFPVEHVESIGLHGTDPTTPAGLVLTHTPTPGWLMLAPNSGHFYTINTRKDSE